MINNVMNRNRDLENIGLIYEGYAGIDPENIGVRTSSGIQKKAVRGLLRRGYEVHDEYTKKTGGKEIVLVRGENLIKNLNDSEEVVGVDIQGKINGQPYQSFLSDIEEDEQSSALAQGLADERENQNPLEDYEGEETMEGKVVSFTTKPSLDQLRGGAGVETYRGKVVRDLGDTVLLDLGVGLAEIPKSDLDLGEDNEEGTMETTADDQGPNQITADGPASAMGGEEQLSGDVSPITQSSKNPDTGDETFDAPDEDAEFNMDPYYKEEGEPNEDPDADEKGKAEHDERSRAVFGEEEDEMSLEDAIKVINKHLKDRVHGSEKHANKEVRDAKLAYVRGILKKRDETKKESFNSHGDRDMSLLAEKYLNIKHDE
jgi:hypothetical protein